MPTQYDKLCTVVYTIDGIEHTTQLTTPAIYRDETIEFLLREMQPSARLISTEWQQIPKWIAKPTGDTIRHERAMRQIGFRWDGCDWSMISPTRPPRPWGCKVYRYRPPKPPRKGFGAAIGIMSGTHDEFGKPLYPQHERERNERRK